MGTPEMQTQTQPSRRVQAVKPNPRDGHKHPAPNPWDGCGAVHLTQSQPTRPRPSQSPLQCSPTRRSGLPGTERFISLHVGNFFGTRTTEPFEPYFSAIACHVALCRVALGLHSAPPVAILLVAKAKDETWTSSAWPVPAIMYSPSATRGFVPCGCWSGASKHWIRTHSEDPSIQRIAKDSKHNTFDRI